jgi:hypothetical protein
MGESFPVRVGLWLIAGVQTTIEPHRGFVEQAFSPCWKRFKLSSCALTRKSGVEPPHSKP